MGILLFSSLQQSIRYLYISNYLLNETWLIILICTYAYQYAHLHIRTAADK